MLDNGIPARIFEGRGVACLIRSVFSSALPHELSDRDGGDWTFVIIMKTPTCLQGDDEIEWVRLRSRRKSVLKHQNKSVRQRCIIMRVNDE